MSKSVQKVALTSEDIPEEKMTELKQILPSAFAEGKINWEKLKLTLGAEIDEKVEKYGLSWAGKTNAFKAIRVPAAGTLVPQEKDSVDWDKTENVFIEGDNLEVLKLLQKHYREQIKMIYIDPPYNTGKDFIYKDNFTENTSDYYERTGQSKDGVKLTSNLESNGRYHSDWLTMMYPRLFLARNLLREDGVIFVSIDDNEVANLRLIMDEIFGEENLVGVLKWKRKKQPSYLHGHIGFVMEYVIIYAKNIESLEKLSLEKRSDVNTRIDNATNSVSERLLKKGVSVRLPSEVKIIKAGIYKNKTMTTEYLNDVLIEGGKTMNDVMVRSQFRNEQSKIDEFITKNILYITKNYGLRRNLLEEEKERRKSITDLLLEWGDNQESDKEMEKLFPEVKPFDYPKPVKLVKNLVASIFSEGEIILDFFAGSCTTAEAVMSLNAEDSGGRKWICVQLPEELDESNGRNQEAKKLIKERINFLKSIKKLLNIAEIAKERIRRVSKQIAKYDVGFKDYKLSKSYYRQWNSITDKDDEQKLKEQMKLFLEKPLVDGYDEKSVVYEVLVKEGFNLNSEVEIKDIEKEKIWSVVDGDRHMFVSFAKKISQAQVGSLSLGENDIFVCLDSALDDTTKVNFVRNLNLRVI